MKKGIFLTLLSIALIVNVALAKQSLVDSMLHEGLIVFPETDASGVRSWVNRINRVRLD